MDKAADILSQLSDLGFKKTRVRDAVVSYLSDGKKPVDALAIQDSLKKRGLAVNKTTVYRELQFLLVQGIIIEINFGDNKKRYEIAGLPHHHHLVCTACGIVQDVAAEHDLARLEKKIENETSFIIKNHSLEFFGLCRRCQ